MPPAQASKPPIIVNLHSLKLAFQTPNSTLQERFEAIYGHLPRSLETESDVIIDWHLHPSPAAPFPPSDMLALVEDKLVSYYRSGHVVAIRMPKYGLITVDLNNEQLLGAVTHNCLEVYGAFEDVMMISLAPLYRRRGWFPLHAFAALAPNGRAALITGNIGAGKTTTGLSLLNAGWKLLSNDSPLLTTKNGYIQVLAYPGRLSVFDDSLARFENLKRFIPVEATIFAKNKGQGTEDNPPKRVFRAEDAFADPWATSGIAGGVFFPKIVPDLKRSELVEVAPTEAVLQLMPQAIEGWDKMAIAQNLQLLSQLVEQVPCYILKLSPDVEQLSELMMAAMPHT